MLDQYIRPLIDKPLNALGKILSKRGFSANQMTLIGLVFGVVAIVLIANSFFVLAALLILGNRIADGLDGAIARNTKLTDFGGFLDIVCDFIIYAGVVFAFGLMTTENLFYANFLLFSFIGPITSFLAYAIIASKNKITTEKRGKKSFYYLGGICEGTETAFMLILCCLMPEHFKNIALIFGVLCWLTTFGRIYAAWHDFENIKKHSQASNLF